MELQDKASTPMLSTPQVEVALPPPQPGGGSRMRQYLAAAAVSFGAMATGCELAWTSPALPMLKDEASPFGAPVSDTQGAWVGALLAVGALAGALPGGYAADLYGRRLALAAISAPFLLAWAIVGASSGVVALYIARLLAGLSTGAVCVVAPMYVGEIAEPAVRGALGSAFQLMITVGILFAYVFGALVSFRMLALLCALPPAVLLLGSLLVVPESPLYLVRRGDEDGARRSLRLLRGASADVEELLRELREEAATAGAQAGIKELVSTTARRWALGISLGLMTTQQLGGINAVIFYSSFIFEGAGSTLSAEASSCLAGVMQVAATVVGVVLVDRAGRRPLLLVSAFVMGLCLLTLGICFKMEGSAPGWLPLLAVCLFLITFSIGIGPLPWMMLGELFDAEVKGTASGLAVALNWLIVFVVTFSFPPASESLGQHVVFWAFAVVCFAGTTFIFFCVPETKGKTLQEIQETLSRRGSRNPK